MNKEDILQDYERAMLYLDELEIPRIAYREELSLYGRLTASIKMGLLIKNDNLDKSKSFPPRKTP